MVRGQLSWGAIKLGVAIFREAIVQRTISLRGQLLSWGGGNYPGAIIEEAIMRMAIFLAGNCPRTNFYVTTFMSQFFYDKNMFERKKQWQRNLGKASYMIKPFRQSKTWGNKRFKRIKKNKVLPPFCNFVTEVLNLRSSRSQMFFRSLFQIKLQVFFYRTSTMAASGFSLQQILFFSWICYLLLTVAMVNLRRSQEIL